MNEYREEIEKRIKTLEEGLEQLGHGPQDMLARNAIKDAIRKLQEQAKRARPKTIHSIEDIRNIIEQRKAQQHADRDVDNWGGRGNYGLTKV